MYIISLDTRSKWGVSLLISILVRGMHFFVERVFAIFLKMGFSQRYLSITLMACWVVIFGRMVLLEISSFSSWRNSFLMIFALRWVWRRCRRDNQLIFLMVEMSGKLWGSVGIFCLISWRARLFFFVISLMHSAIDQKCTWREAWCNFLDQGGQGKLWCAFLAKWMVMPMWASILFAVNHGWLLLPIVLMNAM